MAEKLGENPDVERAAIMIQRHFRRTELMFKRFGPLLVCRKSGEPADFGTLSFLGSHMDRPKPYLVISESTSAELMANIMVRHWRLPKPEVIISIHGSAQNFTLPDRLGRIFARGLVSAINSSKATVFTNGSDAGVVKLATKVMDAYGVQAPVVGVAALGCIKQREKLLAPAIGGKALQGRGRMVTYPSTIANDRWGASLNPHHSHFIAVDSGWERSDNSSGGPWGSEQSFRASLEHAYAARTSALIVMLLVQVYQPGSSS